MVRYSDTDGPKGSVNKLWLHLTPPRQISTLQLSCRVPGSGAESSVLLVKPKCRNWAAKLTELMPRFPLVDRTSEKLVEASVRGCRTAAFGVSSQPSFWTCAAPGGARFDQGWRHR